jgi:hypothetical protein
LSHPLLPEADAAHVLFGFVVRLLSQVFGKSATAFSLLAALMVFLQGIYLRAIAGRHRLFARHSYLPAFIYILLSALHPAMGQFSPALLMNWLLLGALDAVLRFGRREEPNRVIFNAGFLLGCAALLHFPALGFALLPPVALLWLRSFRPGEWLVGLLGWLTPFYFAIGLLYLFDALPIIHTWPQWGWTAPLHMKPGVYNIALLAGCVFLLLAGAVSLARTSFRMTVSVRRGWVVLGFALAMALAVSALSPQLQPGIWLCALPPLALLAVPSMLSEGTTGRSRRRFATFAFYLSLALVVFCQLALRA